MVHKKPLYSKLLRIYITPLELTKYGSQYAIRISVIFCFFPICIWLFSHKHTITVQPLHCCMYGRDQLSKYACLKVWTRIFNHWTYVFQSYTAAWRAWICRNLIGLWRSWYTETDYLNLNDQLYTPAKCLRNQIRHTAKKQMKAMLTSHILHLMVLIYHMTIL